MHQEAHFKNKLCCALQLVLSVPHRYIIEVDQLGTVEFITKQVLEVAQLMKFHIGNLTNAKSLSK